MHHLKKLLPRKSSKQDKKRDGAQTTSPSPSVPQHADELANPMASIDQLAPPLNPTDRPSSAPPIGRAHGGGNEYGPSHPISTTESLLESQLISDISIHVPGPSIPHVSSAVQDSNESVLSHLDLAAPRAIAHGSNRQPPPVPHTSSALQDVNDAASFHSNLENPKASSRHSLSTPDNPIHRLPSPTPTSTTLQGTTSAPDKSTQASAQPGAMKRVFTVGKAMLKTLGVVAGVPTIDDFVESLERPCSTKKVLEKYCGRLLDSIKSSLDEEGSKMQPKLKDSLDGLHRELLGISGEIHNGEEDGPFIEHISLKITQAIESYRLVSDIAGGVAAERHYSRQFIEKLPRVEASYDDYACKKQSGPCFGRTREGLLTDIEKWITTGDRSQIYVLSGLAGIGKSTVAFTIADRAKASGCLGASFFFSRDEAERSNAKKVFTTIAFQLCVYDKEFSRAIESVLRDEQGIAATTKDPRDQLEVLILEPLRDIVRLRPRPVVVVVDALDECEEQDSMKVLAALTGLVRELPSFRVVLTTRPEPHLPTDASAHRVFHLQNIDEKIVDDDVRLYLEYSLSQEEVARCLPGLPEKWSASSEEIASLMRATGRLFIVASTVVRFILDKIIRNPRSQMEALKTDGQISLGDLESFYLVILRHAVPPKCKPIIVRRFKTVIGTLLAIQMPLPISALEHLTLPQSVTDIHAVLTYLQSVIMVNKETPQIYHKSFFDFLTNVEYCTADLLIDLRAHHTRIATRCFQIMNKNLKRNILNLGDPARFMDNDKALTAQGISEDQLHGMIPAELRYACMYWVGHVEGADTEDTDLVKECETFTSEHLLHWVETLSWVSKPDIAHRALRSVPRLLRLTSPKMRETIVDAFRLVSKFYKVIKGSALHTYHSALIFAPTQQLLYKRHWKEITHKVCWLRGGLSQWDPLVATVSHPKGLGLDFSVRFSPDSSQLASLTSNDIRFWDAMSGTPISSSNRGGYNMILADDFSVVAMPCGDTVKLYNVATDMAVATFTHSSKVIKLALSHDISRLAVALSNDTISIWDVQKHRSIATLDGSSAKQLMFSPRNSVLASLLGGEIRLWNETNGEFIACLNDGPEEHIPGFVFSRDGSRLASLTKKSKARDLTMWNGENGNFIGAAEDVGDVEELAISDDGSFLAAAPSWNTEENAVKLWSAVGRNPLSLIDSIEIGKRITLAFSRDLLAIASNSTGIVKFYDLRSCTVISTLELLRPISMAFSPDSTRLAAGNRGGDVHLWDTASIKASDPDSNKQLSPVTALAFSPGCSRLAAGFDDGTVELWNTAQAGQPIATHKLHSGGVAALAFSPDGEQLVSGSWDKAVRVWDGREGPTRNVIEHADGPHSVAFSSGLFAAATEEDITIWDRKTLRPIDTISLSSLSLPFSYVWRVRLSFPVGGSSLLAIACEDRHSDTSNVTVWDTGGRTVLATFQVKSVIRKLTLSPDGSRVFAEIDDGGFWLFDVSTGDAIQQTGSDDLSWIPNFNGIPISWNSGVNHLMGRFSEHYERIPLLYFPTKVGISSVTVGPSMFVVGCWDGRLLLVRS